MKKFLFVLVSLVVVGNAFGAKNCTVFTCPKNSGSNAPGIPAGMTREYLPSVIGGNQCYSCDSDDYSFDDHQCDYGAIVGQMDSLGRIVGLWSCVDVIGAYDEWHNHNTTRLCGQGSDLKQPGANKNTFDTFYSLNGGSKTKDYTNNENVIRAGGGDACVYYKCKDKYAPNADRTDCVLAESTCTSSQVYENGKCVEKKTGCENSGGTWNSSSKTCTCSASKNIVQSGSYACSCKSGYDWKSNRKDGCYSKAAVTAQQKCENSGGSYKNGKCICDKSKELIEVSGACVCTNDDYEYNSARKECTLKPGVITQTVCSIISGAEWYIDHCRCKDKNQTLENLECVYPNGYEACQKVGENVANWVDGRCVCVDKNFVWNGTKCAETEESIENRNLEEITTLFAQIEKKASVLFAEKSHWKNAEGEFNGARLASDSIAGVVLGTVGGVVTSSLIKKSQVKQGFEDIKCSIGGQSVASYGDEFSVGLQ